MVARIMLKRITSRRGTDTSDIRTSNRSKRKIDDELEDDDDETEQRVLKNYARLVRKFYKPTEKIARLHRKNLIDRLVFEEDLRFGILRLLTHILIFVFIMETLHISKNVKAMRGIYAELDDSFHFDGLKNVASRDDFISNWIPELSARSKKYFIRGSKYFDTGGAGSVQLNSKTILFSEPKSLGGLSISIHLRSFSFTAWVRLVPEFVDGYIFRKRLLPASKMICWGEFLSLNFDFISFLFLRRDFAILPAHRQDGTLASSTGHNCTSGRTTTSRLPAQ